MKWHIASVSWGKDSLAMLLMLIAKGYPLNEVVFYDTGMEFEAIYHTRDQMLPRLDSWGSSTPDWNRKTRSCSICWKDRFAVSRKAHTKVKYTFGVMYECSICDALILDNGYSWNY